MPPPLILASASPRRREILAQLGIAHTVAPVDVVELAEGEAEAVARHNARAKARAGATQPAAAGAAAAGALVLGADTVVALEDRILPKPTHAAQARRHLDLLSGREHRVISAICLLGLGPDREAEATSTTTVRFRSLQPEEIDWYVATGEWRDRAGGYAIQGRGAALVQSISGDYWTVVGLPVPALLELLVTERLCTG